MTLWLLLQEGAYSLQKKTPELRIYVRHIPATWDDTYTKEVLFLSEEFKALNT